MSITRSGCPYTRATARLDPASRRNACLSWNREVPRWLAANPKVSTVFVVAHFDSSIVVKDPRNQFKAKMTRLHAGVGGAAAVREADHRHPRHAEVDARHAELRAGGDRQAQERRRDVRACRAAWRSTATPRPPRPSRKPAKRVKLIDMTSFFCSATQCFPVVGGALVYKDISHLTDVYASSLGPYLLRKVRSLNGY